MKGESVWSICTAAWMGFLLFAIVGLSIHVFRGSSSAPGLEVSVPAPAPAPAPGPDDDTAPFVPLTKASRSDDCNRLYVVEDKKHGMLVYVMWTAGIGTNTRVAISAVPMPEATKKEPTK